MVIFLEKSYEISKWVAKSNGLNKKLYSFLRYRQFLLFLFVSKLKKKIISTLSASTDYFEIDYEIHRKIFV